MVAEFVNGNTILDNKDQVRMVDLRSDTISKPPQAMRKVMAVAEVGDSLLGEDPSVNELERRCAELLGKEDAVYLPSGTMCNIVSIMVHCNKRGVEFIAGDKSHTHMFEQGAAGVIAGVQCSLIPNNPDGTFCLDQLEKRIRVNTDSLQPSTSLIIVENTQNLCSGQVLPLQWLDDLAKIAARYKVPVHMDGARMMHAAVRLKVPPKRIARDMASVYFCLSKALGCPMGSVLCGSKPFITQARRIRKMLGGGVRQVGMAAAAGLFALDHMIDRLEIDHNHAYQIAKAIHNMKSNLFRVDLTAIHTNIVPVNIDERITEKEFIERLATIKETDEFKVIVKASTIWPNVVRFLLYWEITSEDVIVAIEKIRIVIEEFDEKFKDKYVII